MKINNDKFTKTAIRIVKILKENNYVAYFVGGFVRDSLLSTIRIRQDIDLATNARPDEIIKLFKNTKEVGAHFGVVLVTIDNYSYEIATFRNDGLYSDGRRPQKVFFSDEKSDSQRRDFTINSIFYDPIMDKLIDYNYGILDLKKRLIKCIGNPEKRFNEDYLRMLRAIRFAVQLDFKIEEKTWQAIKKYSKKIIKISSERIRDEFSKILLSNSRSRGMRLLLKSGLLVNFFPEIIDLQGCEQPPQFHPEGDVFEHTMLMLDMIDFESILEREKLSLVLAVLLHDIAKPITQTFDIKDRRIRFNGHDKIGAELSNLILKRLRYSNEIIERVNLAVSRHMMFKDVTKMRESKVRRLIADENFNLELELHRVDCQSSNKITVNYDFLRDKRKKYINEPKLPKALINGNDLKKIGLQPGKIYGKILRAVMDLQLENKIITKEDAISFVKRNLITFQKNL